jgi:hypothetical protein
MFMKARFILFATKIFCVVNTTRVQASYLWSWGDNSYGQTNVPAGLTNVAATACGLDYCLALRVDGTIAAWGETPPQYCCLLLLTNIPANLSNVVAIAAGWDNAMALRANGTVVVWGDNSWGQTNVPSSVVGVVGVSAGFAHCLAVKADGTVAAWGYDSFGQTEVPPGLTNVTAVAAGFDHSLALRADGSVVAWGNNSYGQINVPVDLTNAIAIAGNANWSMALRVNGTVTVWGVQTNVNVPADLTNAVAIAATMFSGMALKANGTVVVWPSYYPVPPGMSGVTAISAGKQDVFLSLAQVAQGIPVISFISPLSQTVPAGGQAYFSVAAVGEAPLAYQWYFSGTNLIAGATNRWLTLDNVATTEAGAYSVRVINNEGSVTSDLMVLSVIPSLDVKMVPGIVLNGGVGDTFRIDYISAVGPTNAWMTLDTVTMTNNSQWYFDISAIGQPARYYRIVQVP